MAEFDHPSLEEVVQNEAVLGTGASNDATAETEVEHTYPSSLAQDTRVKDREQALTDLRKKDPDLVVDHKTVGKMLYDRGNPDHILFNDGAPNAQSRILHRLIPNGGITSLDEIIDTAAVTIDDLQGVLEPGIVDAVITDGEKRETVTEEIKSAFGDDPLPGSVVIVAYPLAKQLQGMEQPYLTKIIDFVENEEEVLIGAAD